MAHVQYPFCYVPVRGSLNPPWQLFTASIRKDTMNETFWIYACISVKQELFGLHTSLAVLRHWNLNRIL
jgi:hypothetical protein